MKSKNLFAGILILFTGVIALLASLNVFEFHWSSFWTLWPLFLVILGISILPLHDYLRAALLIATLGIGCILYYVEDRHRETHFEETIELTTPNPSEDEILEEEDTIPILEEEDTIPILEEEDTISIENMFFEEE